jgi:hypothetical protein
MNILSSMVVTPLPMVAEVRWEQDLNASVPMVMTLLGMITDVIKCPLTLLNAELLMATVEYPPSVEGIVIAPPVPLYPVIVTSLSFSV